VVNELIIRHVWRAMHESYASVGNWNPLVCTSKLNTIAISPFLPDLCRPGLESTFIISSLPHKYMTRVEVPESEKIL